MPAAAQAVVAGNVATITASTQVLASGSPALPANPATPATPATEALLAAAAEALAHVAAMHDVDMAASGTPATPVTSATAPAPAGAGIHSVCPVIYMVCSGMI